MNDLCLLTATWSGDRTHFGLMRASLDHSVLADVPHHVVVQSEDLPAFADLHSKAMRLRSTADVLPEIVEQRRVRARKRAERYGRHFTRLSGSLALRTGGWPNWVRYTGWHTQQITKLAAVAQSAYDTVVVFDSDVFVLPHAAPSDFLDPQGRIRCFEHAGNPDRNNRRHGRWNANAHALLGLPYDPARYFDCAFETPFVLHAPTVRAFLGWLEERYQRHWWDVLLGQPVRRWSEFATYRLFLKHFVDADAVGWKPDDCIRYLFDAGDPQTVRDRTAGLMTDPAAHYVTIHSQSAGRQQWTADDYAPLLMQLLAYRQEEMNRI